MGSAYLRRCNGVIIFVSVLIALPLRIPATESVRWGSDDVTAKVGALFTYHLTSTSNDVFDETCVGHLKISELGKESLPAWLTAELSSCSEHGEVCEAIIEGVPTPDDRIQRYFISVTHVRLCSNGISIKDGTDVFSIDVNNDDKTASGDLIHEPIYCQQGKTETTAAVAVEGDFSRMMSASDRVTILRRFAQHLQLPVSALSLLPASSVINIESSVLVAGPGSHENSPLWASLDPSDIIRQTDSSVIRWTVGCGNVHANHMVVLERLEMTSKDGSLSSALGWPVLGWHVANQLVPGRQRLKRRLPHHLLIRPTAIPQATVVRPTAIPMLTTIVPQEHTTESITEQTSQQKTDELPALGVVDSTPRAYLSTTKARVWTTRFAKDFTKPRISKLKPSIGDVTRSAASRSAKPTSPLPLTTRRVKVVSIPDEKQKRKTTKQTIPSGVNHFTSLTDVSEMSTSQAAAAAVSTQYEIRMAKETEINTLDVFPEAVSVDATTAVLLDKYGGTNSSVDGTSASTDVIFTGGQYTTDGVSESTSDMFTSTLYSNDVEILTTATQFAEAKTTSNNESTLNLQLSKTQLVATTMSHHLHQPSEFFDTDATNDVITSTSQPEVAQFHQSSFASELSTYHGAADVSTQSEISLVKEEEINTGNGYSQAESVDVLLDKYVGTSSSVDATRFDQLTTINIHQQMLFGRLTSTDPPTLPLHGTPATTTFTTAAATLNVPQVHVGTVTAKTSPGRPKNRRPKKKKKVTSSWLERKRTQQTAATRPTISHYNHAPVVKNPIGKLIVESGSVLTFQISNETFFDFEDGGTANLQLLLTSVQHMTLPPNSWIKLSTSGRTLYGLPLDIHIGHHEFILSAIDRQDKIVRCPFEVHVRRRAWSFSMSHEVSVVISIDYQLFVQLVDKRIDVANKIGSVFGDRDPTRHIVVTSLTPGSVVYTWTNSSLLVKQRSFCPLQEITAFASRIQHRNGTMNERFVRLMRPYFISNVSVIPHGPCVPAFLAISHHQPGSSNSDDSDDNKGQIHVQSRPREIELDSVNYVGLLYILIPLIVLAAVLVALLIFICCRELSVKRRRHLAKKLPSASSSSSVLSAVRCASKGIPIIFADELIDSGSITCTADGSRRENSTDSPMFPPPDYRTLVRHGDWDTVASSSVDKDGSDNKSFGVSEEDDEEEDHFDQGDTGHQRHHHDSLRFRTKLANPNIVSGAQKTPVSRGLHPPTTAPHKKQKTGHNGNSPPPPYIQSYVLP